MIRMPWNKIIDIIANNIIESEDNKVSKQCLINLIEGAPLTEWPDCLNNVTRIGSSTFIGYTNLVLTSLPEGITSIGEYTFYMCPGLVTFTFPSTITNIGECAFGYCENLREVTFTSMPSSIYFSAFQGCDNLTTINVPWAEGEVSGAPWGEHNATINYNYVENA